ncbi:Bud-site selection protein [Amniculicola lignicola CBS 123094]|uniref:Bud-site selection protein n=1 Tax=Amniculicola lignicola CBS 123094 TaxID=1392246 RepID=A0A6A5W2U2_9PLEO|nr:Bud-site selection protein [Amniculicola lignicola CBS 123094]
MPKRKRTDASASPSDHDVSASRTTARWKKLCTQRIAAAQKSLVAALRLGAGFERQKYSRRRKTAKEGKDDAAIARLEAEYVVLKALNIEKVAEQHLRKTIAKVKSIRDHDGLPENARSVEKGNNDPMALNVTARLFKVKGVREVVDELIDGLKEILDITAGAAGGRRVEQKSLESSKKKARNEDTDGEEGEDDVQDAAFDFHLSDEEGEAFVAFSSRIAAASSDEEEDSDDSLPDDFRPPSAVDSDESEHDSEGSLPGHLGNGDLGASGSEAAVDDLSISGSDSITSADELPPANAVSKSKSRKEILVPGTDEPLSRSEFLPALSHVNYIQGSDSEASDLDEDLAPKKNRRGQRARQKIWEQKFKDEAKHLKNTDQKTAWDPKRGAVDNNRLNRKGRREGGDRGRGRGPEVSGGNAIELGDRKKKKERDDVGTLHPSWAAAKAAKEKKMAVKPMGKKITFE